MSFSPFLACAQPLTHPIQWQNSSFWTGFMGGLALHEAGHFATAASFGQHAQFNRGSVVYPQSSFSSKQALLVSTAGFQTQWLYSEWSFYELDKADTMWLDEQHYVGLITAHIATSLAYLAGLKDAPTSDIYTAAQVAGRSRNQLAVMAAVPALLDAYRLWGDAPDWVDHLSMGLKVSEVGLIWTFD